MSVGHPRSLERREVAGGAGGGLPSGDDVECDAHHARRRVAAEEGARRSRAIVKRAACARPRSDGVAGSVERARADRLPRTLRGSSGSARRATSPAASSIDSCDGRDHGDAARHRLDDRDAEALESRRVDERPRRRGRAARARRRRRSRAGRSPGWSRLRLLSPAGGADEREPQVVPSEQRERRDEHVEVLARLERRHAEDVRRAQIGRARLPGGRADRRRGRRRVRARRVRRQLGRPRAAVKAEFANTTSQPRRSRYFAVCIRRVRACTHSGKRRGTRSCTVVARTPPRCGGNIQSE